VIHACCANSHLAKSDLVFWLAAVLVQILWGCSQPIMPWKEKVLWDPVNSISALCCLSHLAFAISCVLDCYLLAGSGLTLPTFRELQISSAW